MITKDFEKIILESVLRNDQADLGGGFFVGLCSNETVSRETTLADLVEVTGDGYSRQALQRNGTDWNESAEQPDCLSLRSKEVSFSASGKWSPFTRLFLCTSASGTSGKLLAITTPLAKAVELDDGNVFPAAIDLFLK